MPTQFNIFLLLFGGLQGLLFSLFMFKKKLYRGGYIFLLLYLAVLLLQITLKVMSKAWLMDNWTFLYFYSQYLPLLYGPLAFLFVKYLINPEGFHHRDFLHFMPTFFVLSCMLLVLFNINAGAGQWFLFDPLFRFLIISGSLIIYHYMAFRTLRQNQSRLKQYFSDSRQVQVNWLKQFIIISFITALLITTALYLLYMAYPRGHEYRYAFLVLTIIIYWFSYTALTKPSVFTVIKEFGNENVLTNNIPPQLKIYHSVPRYTNSGLSSMQIEQICSSLDTKVRKEKIYLQPELTIQDLALKLQCGRHHLSQVLNEHLRKSYYDYINEFRVEEAKQMLSNPSCQHHKIATIAYDAGFNSLSTFNDVFRKMTGQTPSQYRKQTIEYARQKRV